MIPDIYFFGIVDGSLISTITILALRLGEIMQEKYGGGVKIT